MGTRDDFSAATRRTIAARAGYRCSNPDCRALTAGPGTAPDTSVNLGVAAHITAAARGGPRYDEQMSPGERVSVPNGIWACRKCGTLIDADSSGYAQDLLRRWKAEAEDRARRMLAAGVEYVTRPLDLSVPELEGADTVLSFANSTIPYAGRVGELAELTAFLENDDRAFVWWLWTGPAGVGKSRLAVELCRAVCGTWHAGFLREGDQERLGGVRTITPTLVVVDYAAQRSEWLSDALFQLSQHDPGAPVRVLVLERDASGPWWETVQRQHRFEEALHVAGARYDRPRQLTGVDDDDLRRIIRSTAGALGQSLTSTNVEDIADHARNIDAFGSPLFAMVATIDWLNSNGVSAGRDEALRRLVDRASSQMARQIHEPTAETRARNLRFLGTSLGGMTVDGYNALLQTAQPPPGLLPGLYDQLPGVSLDELLDGLRPDILGELHVLDRLGAGGFEGSAAKTLLRIAWRSNPTAYGAFVGRALRDHAEHDRVADLLDVDARPSAAWAWLAADAVPLLRRSDHPLVPMIFRKLAELEGEPGVDEATISARFREANLVLAEGDAGRASEMFTRALSAAKPAWSVYWRILNNRGITWLHLGQEELGVEDFTAVITADAADDESRACALNNRADVYETSDLSAAIADRTAVLALTETTYDRRYIALARRARALWERGDTRGAYADVETILATDDIALEQKMEARLQRAKWLLETDRKEDAVVDLEAILESNRNFDTIEARARELLPDA